MSIPSSGQPIAPAQATALCYCCREELPVANFYRDASRWNGISSKCKRCLREIRRASSRCPGRSPDSATYHATVAQLRGARA